MYTPTNRRATRLQIHERIRRKMRGEPARPRLAVFRSIKHIYAQVIDDRAGKTLASASTKDKALEVKYGGNVDAAKVVGKAIGERAKQAGAETVVFDRGGHRFHGRVKALADAAREAGLKF